MSAACFGVAERGEAEQGVHRDESGVAGGDAVAAVTLEMVKEGTDRRCVEVFQLEGARCLAGAVPEKAQQQPQGVAVGGHGVRAGLTLVHQPFGEEGLEGGSEQGHRVCLPFCSRRSAARARSSGAAEAYQ